MKVLGLSGLQHLVDNINDAYVNQLSLASEYSATSTYNVGDYCIHNNSLYKCIAYNSPASWNQSNWVLTTVDSELNGIQTQLDNAVPTGGTVGAVLTKQSNTNFDTYWMTCLSNEEILQLINNMA